MGKRQEQIRPHGAESEADRASGKQRLEQLSRSFEAFRREHRRGTRIPKALRDEALAMLSSGTPEVEVLRACRIVPQQLSWWRRGQGGGSQGRDLPEPKARIFPVVDDVPAVAVERDGDRQWQSLELRIGQWAISIRQLQS